MLAEAAIIITIEASRVILHNDLTDIKEIFRCESNARVASIDLDPLEIMSKQRLIAVIGVSEISLPLPSFVSDHESVPMHVVFSTFNKTLIIISDLNRVSL